MIVFEQIEKLRGWWANLQWVWRVVIALVLLGGGVWFVTKPGLRMFRQWRHGVHLERAHKAVEQGRMEAARDLSWTVLRGGDARTLEALRVLETATGSLNDPMHAVVAKYLMVQPNANDDDRLRGFRAVVAEMPLGVAGQAWKSLPEGYQRKAAFAEMFADRLIAENRLNEAYGVLQAVEGGAGNWAVDRRKILVLIRSGGAAAYVEAQNRLVRMWSENPAEALELLEQIPVEALKPDVLGPVRTRLGSEQAREALMLARLDWIGDTSSRQRLLGAVSERWKARAPGDLARFYEAVGLWQQTIEAFGTDLSTTNEQVFRAQYDAAVQLDDWPRARVLLEGAEKMLESGEYLARRAVVLAKMKDQEAAAAWQRVMLEARTANDPSRWLKTWRIMRDANMPNEGALALLEVVQGARGPLPLFEEVGPMMLVLASSGREKVLVEVCAKYLVFEPGNPVLLTHYAYLACVTGAADPAMVAKSLEPLADAYQEVPQVQCVLAAALLGSGKTEEAARVIDRVKLDPRQLAPGHRAALLAVRLHNGTIRRDDPLMDEMQWSGMMASERKYFMKWLMPPDEKATEAK